jgi:hypothetical protein
LSNLRHYAEVLLAEELRDAGGRRGSTGEAALDRVGAREFLDNPPR